MDLNLDSWKLINRKGGDMPILRRSRFVQFLPTPILRVTFGGLQITSKLMILNHLAWLNRVAGQLLYWMCIASRKRSKLEAGMPAKARIQGQRTETGTGRAPATLLDARLEFPKW